VNAIAALVLGWGVDRYNWPRTYVLAAASLLLTGMYILEVSHPSITRTPVLRATKFSERRGCRVFCEYDCNGQLLDCLSEGEKLSIRSGCK